VDRLILVDGRLHRIDQSLVLEKRAGFDGTTDPGVFLVDHTTGTKIEVTHLGIAHLIPGQSHRGPGAINKSMWIFRPDPVPNRLVGMGNGIIWQIFATTPSI